MSLDHYSTLLSLGSIAIFAAIFLISVFSFFSEKVNQKLEDFGYFNYIYVILLISGLSVAGSLIYQLVYSTPVCELCWWQRIFLYPTVIISLVAYVNQKYKEAHTNILILSIFGFFYACYHYYYHFKGFVLGQKVELPCSYGGLLPACTDSPILIFGFITIPFMGVLMFASIILVCGLVYKYKNN
jgi:disulfide bond formation protein DsbB